MRAQKSALPLFQWKAHGETLRVDGYIRSGNNRLYSDLRCGVGEIHDFQYDWCARLDIRCCKR
jgi:hypothetical protein